MSSTLLFCLNHKGRIFGLSTNETKWKELMYFGLEFTQLSAVPNFLWALGGDGQIYVHVHGLDVPIRVKEEAYENEKWGFFEGLGNIRELALGRYLFSNEDGTKDRTLENIELPSVAWQWETDWVLELILDDLHPLDHDGWAYAVDFQANYYPKGKHWSSFVRRRKWVRYRTFTALNSWCAIAPFYRDPSQERFIGISVGGNQLPGGNPGMMLVWAVTVYGRVMFRTGVSNLCPEGESWTEITIPQGCKASQISVGPTGLVWVVLFNGKALVRTGITTECPIGESWIAVEPPEENLLLIQVSVGSNGLWAITKGSQVFFRKGIRGTISGTDEKSARGSEWVKVVGSMMSVSVASNDQTWAVGAKDKSGVTQENLTGKSWELIAAPSEVGRNNNSANLPFGLIKPASRTLIATEAHDEVDDGIVGVNKFGKRRAEVDCQDLPDNKTCWTSVEAGDCSVNFSCLPNWFTENTRGFQILSEFGAPEGKIECENYVEKVFQNSSYSKISNAKCLLSGKEPKETEMPKFEDSMVDCIIELEYIKAGSDGILKLLSPDNTKILEQINIGDIVGIVKLSEPCGLQLGIFKINTKYPIRLQFSKEDDLEGWITELSSISCRVRNISGSPGPDSLWLTTALGDIFVCDPAYISMEQRPSGSGNHSIDVDASNTAMPFEMPLHAGFLPGSFVVIQGRVHDKANAFTIGLNCSKDNCFPDIAFQLNPRFKDNVVVREAKIANVWGPEDRSGSQPFKPGSSFEIKILCDTDYFKVFVDGEIFTDFAFKNSLYLKKFVFPTADHVTHLACKGDVSISKIHYSAPNVIMQTNSLFWRPIKGHLRMVESAGGVTWGIGFDNTSWVYTGGDGTDSSENHKMTDSHNYYVYEHEGWNLLSGYTSCCLHPKVNAWSDATGFCNWTKEDTKLPSNKWQWVNDWSIDFDTPGGVDNEGWQYTYNAPYVAASDGPVVYSADYHGTKQLTDFGRRRRWIRQARLETDGPWTQLDHTPLLDCSLHVDGDEIVAWALSATGNVLYRRDVSKSYPTGISWVHVAADQEMISISSAPGQVWAVGKNRNIFWRLGITESHPLGTVWVTVKSPSDPCYYATLKQIYIGEHGVWALSDSGRLSTKKIFPVKSPWEAVSIPNKNYNYYTQLTQDQYISPNCTTRIKSFRQFSARSKLWAITSSGALVQRLGVCSNNPGGSVWSFGIRAHCLHIST